MVGYLIEQHDGVVWRELARVVAFDDQGLLVLELTDAGRAVFDHGPGEQCKVAPEMIDLSETLRARFDGEAPMGPGIGTFHERPTQVIESAT